MKLILSALFLLTAIYSRGAEAVLTNFYQYSVFGNTSPVQVCVLNLNSNLFTNSLTKAYQINGTTTNQIAWQQLSSNRVAVLVGIAGDATNNIQFNTGEAPTAFSGFGYLTTITNAGTSANLHQITNGYTGIRIINTNLTITSNLWALVDLQFGNGSWGMTTTRLWQTSGSSEPLDTNVVHTTNIVVDVIESGPLLAEYRVTQLFNRPRWQYGVTHDVPAGTGSNVTHIRFEAFRRGPKITPFSDAQLFFDLVENTVLTNANRVRYRNMDVNYLTSSGYGQRFGHFDGGSFSDAGNSGIDILKPMEPGIDLFWNYSGTLTNSTTVFYGLSWGNGQQGGTGHYTRGAYYLWENTNGPTTAPIFGIGLAHSGQALGSDNCGFFPIYRAASTNYGVRVMLNHLNTSGNTSRTNNRISFYLFAGTRTNITGAYYPMTEEFGLANGFSLAKQTEWSVADSVDDLASKSDRGTYALPRSYMTNLTARLRASEAGLYTYLVAADANNADIINALNDSTGFYTRVLATNVMIQASNFFGSFTQRDSLENAYNFGQGSQIIVREAARCEVLEMLNGLGDSINARLLFASRVALLMYARCLHEADWYPMDAILAGDFLGSLSTASYPTQFINQRNKIAVHLYPEYTNGLYTLSVAISNIYAGMDGKLNASGAPNSSPHYHSASTAPIIENMQLLQSRGITNFMESALAPKLTNFGNWLLSCQTPIEYRLSPTNRYVIQIGDGQWIQEAEFGQLAEVVRSNAPALAMRLETARTNSGSYMNAYFVPGVMTIRVGASATNTLPVSGNFPGYWANLRTRTSTTRESAAWLGHGTWPDDHLAYYNMGWPTFYLMGAPVGVLRNPYSLGESFNHPLLYSSAIATNLVTVTGTNVFGVATSLSTGTDPTNTIFAAFLHSGAADMKITSASEIHHRTIALVSPSPTFDVMLIDDRFTNALTPRYITTSINATGAIGGDLTITPFDQAYTATSPSIGTTNYVGPGMLLLTNRGGVWPNHPNTALAIQSAYHLRDTSNAVHAGYYYTANSPGERNLMLRAVSSNNVAQIVVARLPTATAPTITTNAQGFVIVHGREELKVATNRWEYSLGTETNAAAVLQGTASFSSTNGISISGGPTEVHISGLTNTTISMSGTAGARLIILPASATNGNPLLAKFSGVIQPISSGANVTLTVR